MIYAKIDGAGPFFEKIDGRNDFGYINLDVKSSEIWLMAGVYSRPSDVMRSTAFDRNFHLRNVKIGIGDSENNITHISVGDLKGRKPYYGLKIIRENGKWSPVL